jgi:hypothetical protein
MIYSFKKLTSTHQNFNTHHICVDITIYFVTSDHNNDHKHLLLTTSISTHFIQHCDEHSRSAQTS